MTPCLKRRSYKYLVLHPNATKLLTNSMMYLSFVIFYQHITVEQNTLPRDKLSLESGSPLLHNPNHHSTGSSIEIRANLCE